jgi:hypothetical protein
MLAVVMAGTMVVLLVDFMVLPRVGFTEDRLVAGSMARRLVVGSTVAPLVADSTAAVWAVADSMAAAVVDSTVVVVDTANSLIRV